MKKKQALLIEWKNFFDSNGVEQKYSEVYIEYVKTLLSKDLPPIFDLRHLGMLLEVDNDYLCSMVNSSSSYYRTFTIPKRSGGEREITAPYPSLKYVQRWIYVNILKKIPVHGCAHGFVRKHSILTNAKVHANQKCLLKLDLKDFFPSIPISWVINVFKSCGYENHVAFYLASLCCYENKLAQGSPVSPIISNIVSIHMDRRLYRLAKSFNLKYSRYADDIAFSGDEINVRIIDYIKSVIKDCGFVVNEEKTRLYKEKGNKILAGISLSTGIPKLPRDYRRSLEKELFYINKYGLKGHMAHSKIRIANYVEILLGKIGYWLMIEPDNKFALEMQEKLQKEYVKGIDDEVF